MSRLLNCWFKFRADHSVNKENSFDKEQAEEELRLKTFTWKLNMYIYKYILKESLKM